MEQILIKLFGASYKTTISGLVLGSGISIDAIIQEGLTKGWKQAAVGIGVALALKFAKDHKEDTLPNQKS